MKVGRTIECAFFCGNILIDGFLRVTPIHPIRKDIFDMKNTTLQTESNEDNRPHRPKLVWTMVILILIPAITAIGFMAVLMIREINDKSKARYVSDIVKYMSVCPAN